MGSLRGAPFGHSRTPRGAGPGFSAGAVPNICKVGSRGQNIGLWTSPPGQPGSAARARGAGPPGAQAQPRVFLCLGSRAGPRCATARPRDRTRAVEEVQGWGREVPAGRPRGRALTVWRIQVRCRLATGPGARPALGPRCRRYARMFRTKMRHATRVSAAPVVLTRFEHFEKNKNRVFPSLSHLVSPRFPLRLGIHRVLCVRPRSMAVSFPGGHQSCGAGKFESSEGNTQVQCGLACPV